MKDISLQAASVKPGDGEWAVAIFPMNGEDYILDQDKEPIVVLLTPDGARLFASLLVKYAETTEELTEGTHGQIKLKGDEDDLQALFRLIRGDS